MYSFKIFFFSYIYPRIAHLIEKCFDVVLFLQSVATIMVMCTLAFTLSKVGFVWRQFTQANILINQIIQVSIITDYKVFLKEFTILSQVALELFLPYHFGTQVTVQSENVPFAAFESNWFQQSPEYKKIMFIFMECCKKPIKFNLLFFYYLDMMQFTKVNEIYLLWLKYFFCLFKKYFFLDLQHHIFCVCSITENINLKEFKILINFLHFMFFIYFTNFIKF